MREITAVAIDHLMQMLPTLLPHTETMHGLLGVSQECAQLATVATVAGQLGGAAIIRRFELSRHVNTKPTISYNGARRRCFSTSQKDIWESLLEEV